MAIIDQLTNSKFSVDGPNGHPDRVFGYVDASNNTTRLHDTYSIYTSPNVKLVDFNGNTVVRPESTLDELDPNAPKNTAPGVTNYKSSQGQEYKDLGPVDGHF